METGRPAVMEPDPVQAELVPPREVVAGIRAARSSGWTPCSDGSPFELRHAAAS
ncbi:hypothetical protein ACIRD2_33125 [Streptomyces sp. NPDC093595]|uniref:hypothetical protein n=1 Tax=Streptomyces sp. NPDC093595 TaxID=3366045 RepID=UPI0038092DCD